MSAAPQPSLLWSFNGSTTDSIQGLTMTGGTPVYAPALYGQGLSVSTTTFTNNLPAASNITTVNGLTASCWINQTAGVLGNTKLNFFILNSSVNNNNQESLPSGASKNANQLILAIFFSNGKLAYVYNDYGAGYREYDSGKFPSNNTWYHMCVVVGGGAGPGSTSNTLSFYINGVLDNTTGYTTDMSGTTAYNSVSTAYLTNNTFVINDARVYNTALTTAQVLGIYQSQGIPPSGTLQQVSAPQPSLLWSFNGSNVDSITGLSPATTSGSTTYVSGLYGQAIKFDQGSSSQSYIRYALPPYSPNNFSFSYWVNMTEIPVPTTQVPVYISVDTSDNFFRFSFNPAVGSGKVPYGPGADTSNPGSSISQRTWVHFALVSTWNGTSNVIYMYQNGISYYNPTITASTSSKLNSLYLSNYNSNFSNCAIQDLRVYNTALTAAQVLGIYQSQGIPPSGTLQQVSAPQPSLLWSFNGSNVDSITQLSPSFSNNAPPSYSTGLYGLCYSLPNSAVVSLTPTYSQEYTLALQPPLTISFWFNATTLIRSGTSYISILGLRNNGSSYIDFASNLNGVNDLGMYCRYPNGPPPSDLSFTISTSISINTWYNMCVVFSGTSIQPYLNGVAASSRTFTTWNSTLLGIGTSGQFRGHAFAGYVQDLRIYTTAVGAAQVLGIYQSQGIPPTGSLT